MPFALYADVVLRYPLVGTWQSGDESKVNSGLIYYAETELKSLLATHFDVASFPTDTPHPTIKDLTIDLTYWRLKRMTNPEEAEDIRNDIIGRIDRLKNGDEGIYTGSDTVIEASAGEQEIWSNLKDYHSTFSMLDEMNEYSMVSSERLVNEEDERS